MSERQQTGDRVGAHLGSGGPRAKTPQSLPERLRAFWLTFTRSAWDNPVLVKEFRTRMRGSRAYWMLLGYTLLLAGVLALMYFNFQAGASADPAALASHGARELGRGMYYFVFVAQAIMVALITPAITSGTVTIEREQRSYELLVTTPLIPADIIRGKLSAAVSFVILLLTASLPLVSISFLVGGVSPGEILFSYALVALSAFVYGAIGIFWSATLRTTAVATVVTYLTVLALFILTLIPGAVGQASSMAGPSAMGWMPFQAVNPIGATWRAVSTEYFYSGAIPCWVGGLTLNLLAGLLITVTAMARLEHFEPPRAYWIRGLATLLWLAGGLFFLAPILGNLARSSNTVAAVNENTGILLDVVLGFAAAMVPILNTGDLVVRRGESALKRYLTGLFPHRMFANDLSCGVPLMVLWVVLWLVLIPLGGGPGSKAALFKPWAVFIPGSILCLCVCLGLAGIGHFLSVTLPSRWAACILTYLAGVVLMALPYSVVMYYGTQTIQARTPQPLYQILYLYPWNAIHQLSTPSTFWTNQPVMAFQSVAPQWVVTSILYLAIGAVGYGIAISRIHQQGRHLQTRMEAAERRMTGRTPEAGETAAA